MAPQKIKKPKTIDHENTFITFMKWMKSNGYRKSKCLRPALFSDTDRGIMAGEKINVNDCLISVPQNLLITTSTVMQSKLGENIKKFGNEMKFSPQQILALFLVVERRNIETSFWKPYINVLPKTYSLPIFWKETSFIMEDLKLSVSDQKKKISEAYKKLEPLFKTMESSQIILPPKISFHEFLWGWFTVHTRAVYYQQLQNPIFNDEKDHFALAPFLDFFNHSPHSKVKAGFNMQSHCYEIITLEPYNKYTEVFINYGSHDNLKLLLDYGFVATPNPYSYASFSFDEIVNAALQYGKIEEFKTKIRILKNQNLMRSIYCGLLGPSWNMMTIIKLFLLNSNEMKSWFYYLEDKNCEEQNQICIILNSCIKRKLDQINNMIFVNSLKTQNHSSLINSFYEEQKEILQNTLSCFQN